MLPFEHKSFASHAKRYIAVYKCSVVNWDLFSIAGPPRGGRMSEREAPLVSTETVFETVLPP